MPTFQVETEDGLFEVDAPDEQSAFAALQGESTQKTETYASPSVVSDVLEQVPYGLAKGVIGLAGMPGDAKMGMVALADIINDQLGLPKASETAQKMGAINMLPTSADIQGAIEKFTGEFPAPETTAGEYARTISEFAPAAVAGPGGAIRKMAMTAVPGAASESGGQLTEGTAAEPYARLMGALMGGLTAGGRQTPRKTVKKAGKGAPTAADLKASVDKFYGALRQAGIEYDKKAYARMVQNAAVELKKAGFRPATAKEAFGLVDNLAEDIGAAVDFDDINSLIAATGKQVRALKRSPEGEAAAAALEKVRDVLFKFETTSPFVSRANISRTELNAITKHARKLALRRIQDRVLSEIAEDATTYRAGVDAGLRTMVGRLARSKRGKQLFTAAERDALIKEVSEGRKLLQATSKIGLSLGKGQGSAMFLPAVTGVGLGTMFDAGTGALAVAGGTAAKFASPIMTNRALDRARAAIRSGKLRDNNFLTSVQTEKLQQNVRRLLSTGAGSHELRGLE